VQLSLIESDPVTDAIADLRGWRATRLAGGRWTCVRSTGFGLATVGARGYVWAEADITEREVAALGTLYAAGQMHRLERG